MISDEKWQKDPELLQNSVIQNFIKRKLTKMMEIKSPVIKKNQIEKILFSKNEVKTIPDENVEIYNPKFSLCVKKKKMIKSSSSTNTRNKFMFNGKYSGSEKLMFAPERAFDISQAQVPETHFTVPTTGSLEEHSQSSMVSQYSDSTKVLEYDKDYCKVNKELSLFLVKKFSSKVLLSQTPQAIWTEDNAMKEIDLNIKSRS